MAALIAVLIWQTQWPSLRAGLAILLIGQLILAAAYFLRTARPVGRLPESQDAAHRWFSEEERFVQLTALFDNSARILGFVVLAYGFWTATHILWITLILGAAYPIISYFGVSRRNTRQVTRSLRQQRAELSS